MNAKKHAVFISTFFFISCLIVIAWGISSLTISSTKSAQEGSDIQKGLNNHEMSHKYRQACDLCRKGMVEEGLTQFKQIIQQDPYCFPVYDWILGCYKGISQLDDGMAYLKEQSLFSDPLIENFVHGLYYMRRYQYSKALSQFNHALHIIEKTENNTTEAYILLYKGEMLQFLGRLKEGNELLKTSERIFREADNRWGICSCAMRIGVIQIESGCYSEAKPYLQESLRLSRETGMRLKEAETLSFLGEINIQLGEYTEALRYLMQASKIFREIQGRWSESVNLNRLGLLYSYLGCFDQALDYFENALEIDREFGIRYTEGFSLHNIGRIYLESREYEKALLYFEDALITRQEIEDRYGEALCLRSIGIAYQRQGNHEKARRFLDKSLRIRKEMGDLSGEGECLNDLGWSYLEKNKIKQAKSRFKQALGIGQTIQRPIIIWQAQYGLGRVEEKEGKRDKALSSYNQAIQTIEDIRSRLIVEEHKVGFFKGKINIYEDLIEMLFTCSKKKQDESFLEEAYAYVERCRSRAFLDLLAEANANIRLDADKHLLDEEKRIKGKIARINTEMLKPRTTIQERESLKKKIRKAEQKGDDAELSELYIKLKKLNCEYITNHEREILKKKLGNALTAWETNQNNIQIKNKRYTELKNLNPSDLKTVQKTLPDEKAILLEYFLGEIRSFLFLVEKNNFLVFELPGRVEIEKHVLSFLEEISSPTSEIKVLLDKSFRLYQMLLQPAEDQLIKQSDLIIAPDGVLYALPFEALVSGEHVTGMPPYIIRKHAISYIQSGSVFTSLIQEKKKISEGPPFDLLAFGDPVFGEEKQTQMESRPNAQMLRSFYGNKAHQLRRLIHSKVEIEHIKTYFEEHTRKIFLRDQATEDIFKREVGNDRFRIIHFATHGIFDDTLPKYSSIVLSLDEDSSEDGFLLMNEIFNLPIEADLVVLSACDTGKGKFETGEGLIGLTRAFMYAGASSVTVTLWKVSDWSTPALMDSFYRALTKGSSRAEALRQAKLEMMKSPYERYRHPFFWASFVLIGLAN